MTARTDQIAVSVENHADRILRASGSGLRNYSMGATKAAILSAVMDCYDEAYRAGATWAAEAIAKARGEQS